MERKPTEGDQPVNVHEADDAALRAELSALVKRLEEIEDVVNSWSAS
jgi:hypothetical protein